MSAPTFYEFFAGGGMARAGLGAGWACAFANDFDASKRDAYTANWGEGAFRLGDIHSLTASDLPGHADLAWASFPCQDLSLAGAKAGLDGARSGAFWGFRNLVASLAREGRAPRILALENVVGALTSRGGRDFAALCAALAEIGYRCGAMVIDAADFTPQSRPRLFVIAVRADAVLPEAVAGREPDPQLASGALLRAHALLEGQAARGWVWWRLPPPASRNNDLASITEEQPGDVHWRSEAETQRLLSLMADNHRAKVEDARRAGALRVGAVYRRTRATPGGGKAQRAEVRFDGLAGCLRTPGGGSSRQFLLFVEGDRVRSRLLSGREAARLMGLPDDYRLPRSYTDAYHLLGDGVAPPVVRHLAAHLFEPLLDQGWPDRARDAA